MNAPIIPVIVSKIPDLISTFEFLRNTRPATPPIVQSTKRLVPIALYIEKGINQWYSMENWIMTGNWETVEQSTHTQIISISMNKSIST